MDVKKIVVARIFDEYDGRISSRAGVITRLDPEKFETICIYLVRSSDKESYFEALGYKVFYLSNKSIHSLSPGGIYRLSKILKANKVDIVHCHRHKATVIGTLAAILAGTPAIIAQVHGLGRTRNLKRKLLNYFLFKRITKIITVGEATRQDVLKNNPILTPDMVVNEGNSIEYNRYADVTIAKKDVRKRLGIDEGAFVFGMVGRLAHNKGHCYLLEAFEIVFQQLPNAHLIIIGDGESRPIIEKQIALLSCRNAIHVTGRRSDVPELLQAMDTYVMPSTGSEGIPRAVLEAMAAGLVCIGTDVSGIPEVIENPSLGYIVPSRDAKALAGTMVAVAAMSGNARAEMGCAAREHIRKRYCHEVVAKRLAELYSTVLGNRS